MSVQLVGNPIELAEAPTAPVKEGGGQYRYEMITEGGKFRVYADTPAELLGYFIPGYSELTDEVARTTERVLYAVTVQVALQAMVLADMEMEHGLIPSPEELAVLLAPRDVPPVLDTWESEIPLVLVESYYQPQGELPRPTGLLAEEDNDEAFNLLWLDPGGDMPLLLSLHRVGWLFLSENNNFPE